MSGQLPLSLSMPNDAFGSGRAGCRCGLSPAMSDHSAQAHDRLLAGSGRCVHEIKASGLSEEELVKLSLRVLVLLISTQLLWPQQIHPTQV